MPGGRRAGGVEYAERVNAAVELLDSGTAVAVVTRVLADREIGAAGTDGAGATNFQPATGIIDRGERGLRRNYGDHDIAMRLTNKPENRLALSCATNITALNDA